MPAPRFRRRAASVALAALLTVPAVQAVPAAAAPPVVSDEDRAFMSAVGHGGAFEIAAGRLAVANAADPAIRDFGSRMVADHTTAGGSLRSLATGLGVAMPQRPDRQQQAIVTLLASLTGTALDCSYAPAEYFNHVATVGAFEREVAHGSNPELRTFAASILPTIREHRTMIADAIDGLQCGAPAAPGAPVVPVVPTDPATPVVPTDPAAPVVPTVPAGPVVPTVPVVPPSPVVPGVVSSPGVAPLPGVVPSPGGAGGSASG